MPRITEDLVRRRAEHNNREITTLEELSLHQQEIERIEHLDRWCRDLKILYLQNNLIPKIENVGRLKQLQYLNLALNNVEKIENLEDGSETRIQVYVSCKVNHKIFKVFPHYQFLKHLKSCEFLEKLDLTVNFVGDLLSVEGLKHNCHLRELYLTGNPCTDYEGYREFVVASLSQLRWLDGREVSKSERILATQRYDELRQKIIRQQQEYLTKREREKREHELKKAQKAQQKKPGFDGRWYTDPNAHLSHENGTGTQPPAEQNGSCSPCEEEDGEGEERFWKEPVPYTPESRTEMHSYMAEKMKEKNKEPGTKGPDPPKRVRRLEKDGKMLNVNEGRYDFHLQDDEDNCQYLLEVACPRFMDTSLIDCDMQPTYVRLTMKGKVLQLVLQEEVSPDRSTVKRSQTTGKLLVTMPKVKQIVRPQITSTQLIASGRRGQQSHRERSESEGHPPLLEVDPRVGKKVDFCNIVPPEVGAPQTTPSTSAIEEQSNEEFVDDPDVPPLV